MAQWLLQLGVFAAIFALPCVFFAVSRIIAEEMRDFFTSSALSATVHLMLSAALLLLGRQLLGLIFTPQEWDHFGLVIEIASLLSAAAWLLGASGCLYGHQAPSNRIGPRGIKRYR
ncbi:MAG: hypothetical protein R3E87_06165 [Burkholderiaceae bacterium]